MRCIAWGRETAKLVRARHLRWVLWDNSLNLLTLCAMNLRFQAQRSLIACSDISFTTAQRSASHPCGHEDLIFYIKPTASPDQYAHRRP